MLLEDRATTKILLSDALGVDPAFDRKLLSFYDEMSTLLEESLRDGQALGIVRAGRRARLQLADDGRAEGAPLPGGLARLEAPRRPDRGGGVLVLRDGLFPRREHAGRSRGKRSDAEAAIR